MVPLVRHGLLVPEVGPMLGVGVFTLPEVDIIYPLTFILHIYPLLLAAS